MKILKRGNDPADSIEQKGLIVTSVIKRLAKCIREYKSATILTPVFVMLECLLEIIIPFLMATLIDEGIDAGSMPVILKMGGVLFLCVILSLGMGILAGHFSATSSAGFAKNLRKDMYYKIQNYSFLNIDKFSTASLVTRLTTDVTNIQNAFQMLFRMAVRAPATMLFSLIMVFRINTNLALIFVIMIPILAVALYFIATSVHKIFERVFRTYDKLNNIVRENLRGIRVVKSFVREDYEEEKFKDVSGQVFEGLAKAERILALNNPVMQLAVYIAIILVSWFGARLIVGGSMTTGQLTSVISYATQILMSLMMLSMVFVMITMSRASAQRVTEVLAEESDLKNPEKPIMEVPDGSIVFKNVEFSYAKRPDNICLSDVNIEIKAGETVGIIGGTGSSKSSLIQLIPRLYDVVGGSVSVGGNDVRDYDIWTLRTEVAMVLQKNELFSGTVKENLRWGNKDATDEELIKACKLAQADGFINEFPEGYDTFIEQGGTNVSGGQKQRLCIARALLKNPKILILDDSTSAVDTATDTLIRKAFREEIPNTTKLIVAQRIASVCDADKIIVMDNGRIVAVGNHDELLATNEIYQEVYYSQISGGDNDAA